MRSFDPKALSASRFYYTMIASLVPRPIAWVSTRSAAGVANLAPFSFFMGVSADPPTLALSVGYKRDGQLKDTARNILETGEFVVNIVPEALTQPMVLSSAEWDASESEWAHTGLRGEASARVQPQRVVGSPAAFECTLYEHVALRPDGPQGQAPATQHLLIGRIELLWVCAEAVDERGRIDSQRLRPVARLGGAQYSGLGPIFEHKRP